MLSRAIFEDELLTNRVELEYLELNTNAVEVIVTALLPARKINTRLCNLMSWVLCNFKSNIVCIKFYNK